MKRVLVTSSSPFPEDYERNFEMDHIPFIEINIYPKEQILSQIPPDIRFFIVTSKSSAKAIRTIDIEGEFFVVGKSTAQELYGQEREIAFISNYAEDLLERMLETDNKKYVFFKGNLSLDTLPSVLKENGVEVVGIECYQTVLTPLKIDKKYDALVFMSPSAVKSFASLNEIPKETVIFASGKTTAQAVKQVGDFQVHYPEETTKESLMELINETINA